MFWRRTAVPRLWKTWSFCLNIPWGQSRWTRRPRRFATGRRTGKSLRARASRLFLKILFLEPKGRNFRPRPSWNIVRKIPAPFWPRKKLFPPALSVRPSAFRWICRKKFARSELQDLFLKVEPPFGFSLKSARPAADEDGFWKIGTLEPGENGAVVIKAILAGRDGEEKSFRAAIGLKNREGSLDVYGGGVGTLTVKRPFLDIGIKLNGEKTRIAKAGGILEGEVFFKGTGLDERQIRVEDGTFNASSRSILWNAASNEALRNLDPGQEGIV